MSDFLQPILSCTDNCGIGEHILVSFEVPDLNDQKIETDISYKLNDLSNNGLLLTKGPYKTKETVNFDFISYKEGVFKFEPFKITLGEVQHLTKSFEFRVLSQVKEELKLIDIVPPQKIYPSAWYYIGAVSLILAFIFLMVLIIKKIKPRSKVILKAKVSPYELALKKLSELEFDKNISLKNLVGGVTEAVKKFISDEYFFDILDKTSTESVILLKENKIFDTDKINILKNFFYDADLIKFKDKLSLYKEIDFINDARKIVYALKKEEVSNEV